MGRKKSDAVSETIIEQEKIRKSRNVMRTLFEKRRQELHNLLDSSDADEADVSALYDLMRTKFDEIGTANQELYELLIQGESSAEVLAEEINDCDEITKQYYKIKHLCEKRLDNTASVSNASNGTRANGRSNRNFKLPRIEFIKFSGEPKEWLPFWHQFRKIDEDGEIEATDKIQYLILATTPGSRARRLVDSYPAVGDNYSKIINALKNRFGRDELQVEIYIRELIKQILINANSDKGVEVSVLYDSIETNIRALETMGISKENCAAILFPMIESCLNESMLRAWQRSNEFSAGYQTDNDFTATESLKNRLDSLLNFLRKEVENEQRIVMATERLGLAKPLNTKPSHPKVSGGTKPSTASSLHDRDVNVRCAICDGAHGAAECTNSENLSEEEKKKRLLRKGRCYRCTRRGHVAKNCHVRVTCKKCGKGHVSSLCGSSAKESAKVPGGEENGGREVTLPQQVNANGSSPHIFLQTLRITVFNGCKKKTVRAMLDSGAQRTYICRATARELDYPPMRTETLQHALFGGRVTKEQSHDCFRIFVGNENFSCDFEALSQPTICFHIPSIHPGPWTNELATMGIKLSDVVDASPIELLIGADVLGQLLTGQLRKLSGGLTAVETSLGWTLMGKVPNTNDKADRVMTVVDMLVNDACMRNLWELDVLGIEDPLQQRTEQEAAQAAKDLFLQTVTLNDEGRYEVRLPWLADHGYLPTNRELAHARLERTLRTLRKQGLVRQYGEVFDEWLRDGIIEEVVDNVSKIEHYLPHRPVIKEDSSTFKMRPVFDASARSSASPSLNDCLEKGINLIKLIPELLVGFRMFKVGVISDIRKAFLQVGVNEIDRDVLRFFWEVEEGGWKIFRHRRVAFGVNCSPFLLAATIDYHIERCRDSYPNDVLQRLAGSFYVDNCVTSATDEAEAKYFKRQAQEVMASAGFDLRGWLFSGEENNDCEPTPVLGLTWLRGSDTLMLNPRCFNSDLSKVTKRTMMSCVQKLFDPIGFTAPIVIRAKLLLQELWSRGVKWDDPVDLDIEEQFRYWQVSLRLLEYVKVPRWMSFAHDLSTSVHIFCDASKDAYAAAMFLRVETLEGVKLTLIAAKSRLAPIKKLTIPRLELMSASIASRLYGAMKGSLGIHCEAHFWSDSTTVLAWLRRKEEWAPFVGNRVKEIRSLTEVDRWKHVPGRMNPADLPSRGCSVQQLIEEKWWEGPEWLRHSMNVPCGTEIEDEDTILSERKKKLLTCLVDKTTSSIWHLERFSKYTKTLRMFGWILRFISNVRKRKDPEEKSDVLSASELNTAEVTLFRLIQRESFGNEDDDRVKSLSPFIDTNGLLRSKSRMSAREDYEDIRFPIVLPGEHCVIRRMIFDLHVSLGHVGVIGLMSSLRERFWIVGGRRSIRSVISKCVICKRFSAKKCETGGISLPIDRVRDAVAFEVVGVDFAGPLYLQDGSKSWVCLFTCAVYRAIHLELTTSMSSAAFIQVLRRFVARRGRPTKLITDNGKNFSGTSRLFSAIDWRQIQEYSATNRIEWVFNPPSAPWWGGFWERLVGMTKRNLKRVLGRASLRYEELNTILCDCENNLNGRPLTALPSDVHELRALTPQMFLRELVPDGVPDCDHVDRNKLCRRAAHQQRLRDQLRKRFRNEYLGQLRIPVRKKRTAPVKIGQLMLLGDDHTKRLEWPLVRVAELFPSKDGEVRVVKVRTCKGELVRPVQRLYPLECDDDAWVDSSREDVRAECARNVEDEVIVTRAGRVTRKPNRFSH